MKSVDFLLDALDLKEENRAWVDIFGVEKEESVADHSWSVAFLTLFYGREFELDLEKALKIAIVHDLAEADIGDIANRKNEEERKVSAEEKKRLEKEKWEEWEEVIDDEMVGLWREYRDKDSREARFVKDMDLVDLVLQALKVERQDAYSGAPKSEFDDLDEIFENSRQNIQTEFGRKIFRRIEERYGEAK